MRRRILLLITDLEIGGTPTVVRGLAKRLGSPSVHVEVVCLGRFGPVARQISADGIQVTALGAASATDLRIILAFSSLLRAHRPDTVLSFLVHANAVAALSSLCFGRSVRYLQSIHTTQPRPAWHWAVQRIISHAAKGIVVPSASIARALMMRSGVPAHRIEIIPNAIEADDFATVARPPWTGTIGFIGRLDPVKRVGDLVRAVAEIPSVRLNIFGEGPQRPWLEQLIRQMGLSNRVLLRGQIPRPQEALSAIDVLALPSEAEGLPLVLLEALAAGVPIVATDAPGIRDVVQHERTALLAPVRNPAALAAAIARILRDRELRDRLTSQGACEVRERFSWEVVLPRYRRLLEL